MNPLLQVKLRFTGEKNNQKPGARNLKQKLQPKKLMSLLIVYGRFSGFIEIIHVLLTM